MSFTGNGKKINKVWTAMLLMTLCLSVLLPTTVRAEAYYATWDE